MRPFYTHKHLINLTLKHRPFISFRTLRPPLFLRSFSDALSSSQAENNPSSGPRNGNSSSNDRRVRTVYDPLTGRLAPQRGQKEESGSGCVGDGGRTYLDEGERVYGNAKKVQSEGGSEASRSFDRRVEGFGEKGKGQTGGFGVAVNRYNVYGSDEKANVVEGSGSGYHKEVDNFSGERALEQRSSSGAKQEQEWESGGEALRGMLRSGNEGHDLNIGKSMESVKISDDIVENRLSELGGVHPLPLTMKPEVESASDDVTYMSLSSLWNRISDFDGSVKKANFVVANHKKGVEYFSSEGLTHDSVQGLGSREHAVPSSIQEQVGEVLSLPKIMKQESESTSQNEIQMVSSSSGDRPDDLDIVRTEGSSKKAKLVSESESRSYFDEEVKEVSRERALRVVEKGSSRHGVGQEFNIGDILTMSMKKKKREKKKKKSKMTWVCKKCGHTDLQWWGSCKMCKRVGSMRQISVGVCGGSGDESGMVVSSIREQVGEVPLLPKTMNQESESTSQNKIQTSSSGNRPDDLDIDRTEGSSKKAKLVSGSESISFFDEEIKEVSRERAFRVVEKGSSRHGVGQEFSIGDILTTSMKKKKKSKWAWVCNNCGHTVMHWWGSCKMCKHVGSMRKISVGDCGGSGDESVMVVSENGVRSLFPK